MRAAGLVVGRTLEMLRDAARPGVTTASSTRSPRPTSASSARRRRSSATTGSRARSACRSTTRSCTACPAPRVLAEGDVVSIDCGAIVDGWHGDAAITVALGEVPDDVRDADAGHRGVDVARHRRGPPRRPGQRHLARRGEPRARQRRLRHPRGLHRPRDRLGDAPVARRAQLRPPRARAQARAPAWRWPSSRW